MGGGVNLLFLLGFFAPLLIDMLLWGTALVLAC